MIFTLIPAAKALVGAITVKRALIFLLIVVIAAAGLWVKATYDRAVRAERSLADLHAQIDAEVLASQQKAAEAETKAITEFVENETEDRPVVTRVVERIRNVCLRQGPDHLQVPAAPGSPGPTSGEAEDDRARADEQFAIDLADDLATCQSELNRLDAIRTFHNSLVD